jgi:adenine-specific DNA-methyltransferase
MPQKTKTANDVSLRRDESLVTKHIKNVKKDYGIFFTPEWVVDIMVNLIDSTISTGTKHIRVLEPACGVAQFLRGIKRNNYTLFEKASLIGVEINESIIKYLNTSFKSDKIKVTHADYLLWQTDRRFDVIIGNPPYGIPSPSDHYTIKTDKTTKEKYKALYQTWYGKYNVYGAFVEKSIKLLLPGGQLIFIIPATFMILDEFKKLRAFLSKNGTTRIIYMGGEVFKPDADVASVILEFKKSNRSLPRLELLEFKRNKTKLIKKLDSWNGTVITFETSYTAKLQNTCSYRLGDVYDIRVSPRTPEIKHNKHIKKEKPVDEDDYLPLLNGKSLKCFTIAYENHTGYWIKKEHAKKMRGYYPKPHIVVGLGFRENGRVGAAYDKKCYPWMGDVYHLLRKSSLFAIDFDLDDLELVEFLNSDYVRRYVKQTYKEITYHLSITQLKALPLPTKSEWKKIKEAK